jgi:hypothetical protein
VQCVATAKLLQQAGAAFWDLGMALDYKLRMGAKCVLRAEFLAEVAVQRERPAIRLPQRRIDCKQFARTPAVAAGRLARAPLRESAEARGGAEEGAAHTGASWGTDARIQFAQNRAAWEKERRATAVVEEDLSSVSSVSSRSLPSSRVGRLRGSKACGKGSFAPARGRSDDQKLGSLIGGRRVLARDAERRRCETGSPGSLPDASAEADMSWVRRCVALLEKCRMALRVCLLRERGVLVGRYRDADSRLPVLRQLSSAGTPRREASPLPLASACIPDGAAGKEFDEDLSSSVWGDLPAERDGDGDSREHVRLRFERGLELVRRAASRPAEGVKLSLAMAAMRATRERARAALHEGAEGRGARGGDG